MFERYTEKARRAIFFARYEASQSGSPYIESEARCGVVLHFPSQPTIPSGQHTPPQ